MSRKRDQQIEWRREKVEELWAKGPSHRKIAAQLHVSKTTVTKDIDHQRQQSKERIKNHVEVRLPETYDRCTTGMNLVLEEVWNTVREAKEAGDRRAKLGALSLAKDCYAFQMELVDTGTVVEQALKMVNDYRVRQGNKPLLLIAQKDEVRIDDPTKHA